MMNRVFGDDCHIALVQQPADPERHLFLQDNIGQQTPSQTVVGWCTRLNGVPNSATAIQAR